MKLRRGPSRVSIPFVTMLTGQALILSGLAAFFRHQSAPSERSLLLLKVLLVSGLAVYLAGRGLQIRERLRARRREVETAASVGQEP